MTGGTGERWAAGGLAREYPDAGIEDFLTSGPARAAQFRIRPADAPNTSGAIQVERVETEPRCCPTHPGCCHRPRCEIANPSVGASGGDREHEHVFNRESEDQLYWLCECGERVPQIAG